MIVQGRWIERQQGPENAAGEQRGQRINVDISAGTKELTPENITNIPAAFERNETVRIEAFSDGVLTIAITLLVLGITLPKAHEFGAGGSFSSALIKMRPIPLPS